MSDGELDEGSNYEALRLKGELGLNNLFPVVDRNGF
jgi:transketolase N-terminal domain/subunit